MRIVYLANSRWPRIRGAERLLFAFAEHGRAEGHDITVLAPEASAVHRACREMRIPSIVAEFSPSPWKLRGLKATLKELRPDVVHGMSIFPVALIRIFRLLPVDGSVGFFAYVSTDPTSSLPVASAHFRRLLLAARNAVSRRESPHMDAIFAASETISQRLASVGIRGRIIDIPGVIDADKLASESLMPLPLPDGTPRIGYGAYLEKLKGIDDLISAFAQVSKTHPTATLLVAGEGPEKENLTRLAEEIGVGGRVHFLGFVDPIAPLLAALDVFVSPSHSEAFGISIVEAMAMGLPCVCTDVGGTSEVIHDGETGLLVPPSDPEALSRAIDRLLDDDGFASLVAENGRDLVVRGKYSLESTLETVFGEYAHAAQRSSGGVAS